MSAPSTCTLSGKVYSAGALATTPVLVRVRIAGLNGTPTGDGQSVGTPATTYTAAGLWSVVIPQGVAFRIQIPQSGLDAIGTAPATATADLADITLSDYGLWARMNPWSTL